MKQKPSVTIKHLRFLEDFVVRSTTIQKGVTISGEFVEDSEYFRLCGIFAEIPRAIVEEFVPVKYKKAKVKKVVEKVTKKSGNESARISGAKI